MATRPLKLSDREADEVKQLADKISSFVNGNSEEALNALGKALAFDHRTLVQSKGRIIRSFLKQLQENHKEGHFDLRNKAICEWADEVLTKVDGPNLPFV
jgi:hypothetical protein